MSIRIRICAHAFDRVRIWPLLGLGGRPSRGWGRSSFEAARARSTGARYIREQRTATLRVGTLAAGGACFIVATSSATAIVVGRTV